MLEELAVLRIGPELDQADPVDRPDAVVVGEPGLARELAPERDHDDVALLVRALLQLLGDRLEIERAARVVETDDVQQLSPERALKERVRLRPVRAEMLDGEIDCLVVLDREVVVVDAENANPSCAGRGVSLDSIAGCSLEAARAWSSMIAASRFSVVWMAPLLMSAPIHRRPSRCATAAVVPQPMKQSRTRSPGLEARSMTRSEQRLRLLGRIVGPFAGLALDRLNVVPDALERNAAHLVEVAFLRGYRAR